MYEVDEAAKIITRSVDSDAKIIFGAVIDESMSDEVRITVIATGFEEAARKKPSVRSEHPIVTPLSFEREEELPLSRQGTQARSNIFSQHTIDNTPDEPEEEEELDIPAFIRKKMK